MSSREILDKCVYLSKLSDAFKDDLSKLMMPFDAPEGHVFISEGDPINSFLVVESGTLVRTKDVVSFGRRMSSPDDPPIEIDAIGPNTCSGLLHVAGQPDEGLDELVSAKQLNPRGSLLLHYERLGAKESN